jgi:hypothetical protein
LFCGWQARDDPIVGDGGGGCLSVWLPRLCVSWHGSPPIGSPRCNLPIPDCGEEGGAPFRRLRNGLASVVGRYKLDLGARRRCSHARTQHTHTCMCTRYGSTAPPTAGHRVGVSSIPPITSVVHPSVTIGMSKVHQYPLDVACARARHPSKCSQIRGKDTVPFSPPSLSGGKGPHNATTVLRSSGR